MKFPAWLTRSLVRKVAVWTLAVIFVWGLFGFLALGRILRSVAVTQISRRLRREVSIREITFNPFTLTLVVKGFSLEEPGGSGAFASFEQLLVDLQLASIFRRGPVVREVRLASPHISLSRLDERTYNFSDLLPQEKPETAEPSEPSAPLRYSINNIQVWGGTVEFDDRPRNTRHAIRDMKFAIPFFSNLPYATDIFVQPHFSASVNGSPVFFRGKTKPFKESLETSFGINIDNLDLPYYLAYVPFPMKFRIVSGQLQTRMNLVFTRRADRSPALILTGKTFLRDFAVDAWDRPLLRLPLVEVEIGRGDIFARALLLDRVFIEKPRLAMERDKEGTLNLVKLMPEKPADESTAPETAGGKGPAILVEAKEIRLGQGEISFLDLVPAKPFKALAAPIEVTVSNFSTAPGKVTKVESSLSTDGGETMTHTGEIVFHPLSARGNVSVSGIPLKRYAPYYEGSVLFDVASGNLDIATRYEWSKGEGEEAGRREIADLGVSLKGLRLQRREDREEFLSLPAFTIGGTDANLAARNLVVGEIAGAGGRLLVRRESDGSVNLAKLLPPPPTSPPPETAAPQAAPAIEKGAPPAPPPSWSALLKRLRVERWEVRVEDRAPWRPVTITVAPLGFTAEGISNAKESRGKVSAKLTVNGTGTMAFSGTLGIAPLAANLSAEISGLDLVPLQSYFNEKVKILLTAGAVSAKGALNIAMGADNRPGASFMGQASVDALTALDRANNDELIKWEALILSGIDAAYNPTRVGIADVILRDFFARIIVRPDGMNIKGIVEKPPAEIPREAGAPAVEGPASPEAAIPVKIGVITLSGGKVNFTDRKVTPNYDTDLTGIEGKITGLVSEEGKAADLTLKAALNNYAPLEVSGRINPLAGNLYADFTVDFENMDLAPVTPYSAKYAGRTIQKGILSLDLKYLIEKRKLDSQNQVFIDQFTFGEKVESPDATSLPVGLAVALLKDRSGRISLDLPVSGSLDDPEFSIWGIVLKMIVNLLVKVATSPFALLGAMFGGGGEELSFVPFDYGQAAIAAEAAKSLDTLAKALYQRPALKMDIVPRADAINDREALRRMRLEQKVKAQKLVELVIQGKGGLTLEEIALSPEEYPVYLKQAYLKEKQAPGSPPGKTGVEESGKAKAEPAPPAAATGPQAGKGPAPAPPPPEPTAAEMEAFLLDSIQVGDDDLRQLAVQRSETVKDYLIKGGPVEPERLFLVDPSAAAGVKVETKEGMKESRVDFVIK